MGLWVIRSSGGSAVPRSAVPRGYWIFRRLGPWAEATIAVEQSLRLRASVSGWIKRIRSSTVELPSRWGLGQAEIHSSLPITLAIVSFFFLSAGYFRVGLTEYRTLAVTLPIVWVVSLAVRLAAQQLAVGGFTEFSETVIGPSGNLRTDYEYFPARVAFAYSITGQLVSLGLMSLGVVIVASILPTPASELSWEALCDLRGGWESRAWASQIMWLNGFLFVLHLMPTVPFDCRAMVLSFFGSRATSSHDPGVFRQVASLDSHLAAAVCGGGIVAVSMQLLVGREIFAWCAALAASIYLFVASQWESSRADELEQEMLPTPISMNRQDRHSAGQDPHLTFQVDTADHSDALLGFAAEAFDSSRAGLSQPVPAKSKELPPADVDEILRKLHRCGQDSLTEEERQALISASQEIQASREAKRR